MSRIRNAATMLVAATGMVAGALVAPAHAADKRDTEGDWLRNANSRKCLAVHGTASGAGVFQYDCRDYADQSWEIVPVRGHVIRWRNTYSGQCLTATSRTDNARVVQRPCTSSAAQNWEYTASHDGAMMLNDYSGKCLTVRGHANSAPAVQYRCVERYLDQWWW
jgi:hypothetical protein